jgi:hypothetical protein
MNAPNGQPAGAAGAPIAGQATGMPGASVLVVPAIQGMQPSQSSAPQAPATATILPAWTTLLMTLQGPIHLRTVHAGDAVYLRTSFPVVVHGQVLLPAGAYVQGMIIGTTHPRQRSNRSIEIQMRLTTIILQSGQVLSIALVPVALPGLANSYAQNRPNMATETEKQQENFPAPGAVGKAPKGHSIGPATGLLCSIRSRAGSTVVPQGTPVEARLPATLELRPIQAAGLPGTAPPN